jgi:hypothetical protein
MPPLHKNKWKEGSLNEGKNDRHRRDSASGKSGECTRKSGAKKPEGESELYHRHGDWE